MLCRDVLCTDKTGTLTVDEVTLLKSLDVNGNDSREVLKLAYANSHFQVGITFSSVGTLGVQFQLVGERK